MYLEQNSARSVVWRPDAKSINTIIHAASFLHQLHTYRYIQVLYALYYPNSPQIQKHAFFKNTPKILTSVGSKFRFKLLQRTDTGLWPKMLRPKNREADRRARGCFLELLIGLEPLVPISRLRRRDSVSLVRGRQAS